MTKQNSDPEQQEVEVIPEFYGYRDFNNKHHEIDPMQIIGYETEAMGSCIMLITGGARLDNIARPDRVKNDVEKLKAKRRATKAISESDEVIIHRALVDSRAMLTRLNSNSANGVIDLGIENINKALEALQAQIGEG